ncbi:SDR family NAD(P)-dependent oxidoreductase [Nocardia heshunensis]
MVVNISRLLGLIAFPTQNAYCASKFAVRGYTEALCHELHGDSLLRPDPPRMALARRLLLRRDSV